MNSSARGLAALCLALIASRASAATITQTKSFSVTSPIGPAYSVYLGSSWQYAPFDSALGDLSAVQLDFAFSVDASVWDVNNFATPSGPGPSRWYTPMIDLTISVPMSDGSFFTPVRQTAIGTPTFLLYGQSTGLQHTFEGALSATTVKPTELAAFSGAGSHLAGLRLDLAGNNSSFGAVSGVSHATVTLTYVYGVPDAGSTLLLLAPLTIALVIVHRWRRFEVPPLTLRCGLLEPLLPPVR